MQAVLKVLGHEVALQCAQDELRRIEDLAVALEARLALSRGDAVSRLVLTALALMDEAQTTGAALVRARAEIERLSDMVVESRLETAAAAVDVGVRGRVQALRATSAA